MSWNRFLNSWADVGQQAFADLVTEEDGKVHDPELPEEILSGLTAKKFIFGRTDLGDYRNELKNVYGNKVGVTAHVKRALGQNILTIEDFAGECPLINIVTSSGKKITLNIGKIPSQSDGQIETTKLEF
jgi:hypothetical protein